MTETQSILDSPVRLILVDDGSAPPLAPSALGALRDRLPSMDVLLSPANRGKGHALRLGVGAATADRVVFTDVDFPYTTESLAAVVARLDGGADVAVGSRDAAYYGKVPRSRALLSRAFRWLMRHTFRLSVADTQCGLKGFTRRGREAFLRTTTDGFLYDLEFIQRVSATPGLRLEAVPVTLRPGVSLGRVRGMVLLRESLSLLRLALRRSRP